MFVPSEYLISPFCFGQGLELTFLPLEFPILFLVFTLQLMQLLQNAMHLFN